MKQFIKLAAFVCGMLIANSSVGQEIFEIGTEIKVGEKADLTVYDLNENYNIDSSKFV